MSDREIIDGFLKNDPSAYRIISEWVYSAVLANSYRTSLSVDDIAGDTICKVLINLREGSFRFDSTLKTYVQRIARYTLIDAVRSNRTTTNNNEVLDTIPDPSPNPLSAFESAEEQRLFRRVLSGIDEPCRTLWKLIFHDELPYNAVARKLGLTEGAVKTRVHRCKEKAINLARNLK